MGTPKVGFMKCVKLKNACIMLFIILVTLLQSVMWLLNVDRFLLKLVGA